MITADYCRLFARYNSWQNHSLVTAADGLSDDERWSDRRAFFKSIAATLNHLYWADALMLERLQGNERPHKTVSHSLTTPSIWSEFKCLRTQRDSEITHWANKFSDEDLHGEVAWYPPQDTGRIVMSKTVCVLQLFNHQTHHRGQIHAMLTAAGAKPEQTDIPKMP